MAANDQLTSRCADAQRIEPTPARRFAPPVAPLGETPAAASVLIPHRRVPLRALSEARAALPQRAAPTPPRAASYAVADPSVYWG
jgi:hypothetical protein